MGNSKEDLPEDMSLIDRLNAETTKKIESPFPELDEPALEHLDELHQYFQTEEGNIYCLSISKRNYHKGLVEIREVNPKLLEIMEAEVKGIIEKKKQDNPDIKLERKDVRASKYLSKGIPAYLYSDPVIAVKPKRLEDLHLR